MLYKLLSSILIIASFQGLASELETKPDAVSRLIDSLILATPVKRIAPKYPSRAARSGQEGWVQLSFVVSKDGDVEDVLVLNNAGSNDFIAEAKKAVKKWHYSPALNSNGDAIESCQNSVQLDFRLGKSGISKKFKRIFDRASTNLDEENITELKESIDDINNYKNKNISDLAWAHYLQFRYYLLTENKIEQYHHLKQVSRYAKPATKQMSSTLPESISVDILHRLFIFQLEKQLFTKAMSTFELLTKFENEAAQQFVKSNKSIIQNIQHLVQSETPILVQGELTKNVWTHELIRNSFSITNIHGDLDKLEVRCQHKRNIFTVQPDNQWTIPDSWGQCSVLVEGQKHASFKLIELNQSI
jgi:TonB family protein